MFRVKKDYQAKLTFYCSDFYSKYVLLFSRKLDLLYAFHRAKCKNYINHING